MLNVERALRDNSVLRSLTGLNVRRFEELSPIFAEAWRQQKIDAKEDRQRAFGGGRNHTLEDPSHKLFFILLYLKVYPTMALAGFLFGVGRSRICDWVHEFQPALEAALDTTFDLPKRQIKSMDEFLELFPNVQRVVIDGSERPRRRPQDREKQKRHYSGKKKRHTVKNTLVVDQKKSAS